MQRNPDIQNAQNVNASECIRMRHVLPGAHTHSAHTSDAQECTRMHQNAGGTKIPIMDENAYKCIEMRPDGECAFKFQVREKMHQNAQKCT